MIGMLQAYFAEHYPGDDYPLAITDGTVKGAIVGCVANIPGRNPEFASEGIQKKRFRPV